jgi:glutamate 5-kinase
MQAKIDAAVAAVKPGSSCYACIIASGTDLNSIRSILAPRYDTKFGASKGTLFVTPGSGLEKQALREIEAEHVSPTQDLQSSTPFAVQCPWVNAKLPFLKCDVG